MESTEPKTWAPRRPDAPRLIPILTAMPPEWTGWQIQGNYLVTPTGEKIHQRRVLGMAFREYLELRRQGFASRRAAETAKRSPGRQSLVKVVIVDLQQYRVGGLAAG